MSYLVRKINVSKWPDGENKLYESLEELEADAISDLKTEKNELSWWSIDNLDELPIIAATIISNFESKQNNLKFVVISKSDFDKENISYQNTPNNGKTAIIGMNTNHFDVVQLNYKSLGTLANLIALETSNGNVKSITWKQAIDILKNKNSESKVNIKYLSDLLRKEL